MEERESPSEAVLAANDAFYHAFNEKDIEAMDAVWSASPDVACIHPGWNLLLGREAVIESWRRILTNPGQMRIFTGGETVVFVGEVALVLCRELVGGSPLAATNVFVQENGAWKLLHHHSGPVSAGA
jgi:ketosteroid isomerase-like protein